MIIGNCPVCGAEMRVGTDMTNADRIRAMSDEEIEDWYWWMHKEMMYYTDSRAFVHDWLKQEVDDE